MASKTQRAHVRRTAEFHPSVWGNYFITHMFDDDEMESVWTQQLEVLKKEVRNMLLDAAGSHKLNLMDVVQRLGIGYFYEAEIEETLKQIYDAYSDNDNGELHIIALKFRLLRQQGYNASSGVFNQFKDGQGNFKESLKKDVQGILSLYEASYLSIHGEYILDEALAFTKTHLQSIVNKLVSPLADKVSHALKRPLRKGVRKHEELFFISIYEQEETRIEAVLKLAKLNFNLLQKMYQKELSSISKWWIDLDFTTKLPFARDRLIENYFWVLGAFTEPHNARSRRFLTKVAVIVSVLDDMYDVHGTIEELEVFTKTIERWDTSTKGLPDYMKLYFEALVGVLDEINEETTKDGRSYCLHYMKEAEKNQARAYLTELRWFNEDYVPTLEEYRCNGVYTSCYPLLGVAFCCGMTKIASKEVFDWLFVHPKIIVASGHHCRLMDDIKSHEFEQKRGHVASAVECYMKQYGVSKQEAYGELNKLVDSDWKIINEELLKEDAVPRHILSVFLNFACVMDVLYTDFDGYTVSKTATKDMLNAMLVNPMAIN